jgi:hypothetical protein
VKKQKSIQSSVNPFFHHSTIPSFRSSVIPIFQAYRFLLAALYWKEQGVARQLSPKNWLELTVRPEGE